MKAVILAGGKGTRLGHLTKDIPKPMIPLAGKPLLQYQIELCVQYQIKEVILIVNHLKKPIQEYFGYGEKWGIKISYYEEASPLGTVGGIKEIENQLTENFLVLYGDVMMDMDLDKLLNFHQQKNADATLVVHPNDHPYDSDLVEMDEQDAITKILPKPHPQNFSYHNMVNAAVYIFKPKVLQFLEKGKKADFGKDIFPKLYNTLKMYGYNTPEYLKDMGTPDRLEQVEADIRSGKVARRSLKNPQKAIFLDRDGVLNLNHDLIKKPSEFELYPFTAEAVKKINRSEYISVITTNQSVVARNLTTIKGLGEIHKKMETLLGNEGAKIDALYYCPHHPDGGYPEENKAYKIDCDCRKPKPGMLLQAAERFHINTAESFMIGDSESDTLAGKAAGCTTIGVMTGFGHKKAKTRPDYLFQNLTDAVDFIIDEPYYNKAQKIIHLAKASSKKPFIINIGGNTRSGKSTLATYLQKQFEQQNISVLKINLDDWILPKEARTYKEGVLHNFNQQQLESDIQSIINGESLEISAYKNHPLAGAQNKTYTHINEDIILIEGVTALATEKIRSFADYKIFKKINDKLLQERIHYFYQWKGHDEGEIKELYKSRKSNEYDIIAQNHSYADLII